MKRIFVVLVAVIFAISLSGLALAKDIGFVWDPNSEGDLAGYRLYESQTSGQYTYGPGNAVKDIAAGTETVNIVKGDGTYYWVLTAYDTSGNESGPSNEVTYTVDETGPSPPTNFRFTWQ
jgi:hypothetical protein